jgi:hypothetical protein
MEGEVRYRKVIVDDCKNATWGPVSPPQFLLCDLETGRIVIRSPILNARQRGGPP